MVELIRSLLLFWKDKYSKIDAQGHWLILGWGVGASKIEEAEGGCHMSSHDTARSKDKTLFLLEEL